MKNQDITPAQLVKLWDRRSIASARGFEAYLVIKSLLDHYGIVAPEWDKARELVKQIEGES